MFETVVTKIIERWCGKLGFEGDNVRVESEVVELIDCTPEGPLDSLIVAEAVISERNPPTIINMGDIDVRSRLRGVDYGLESYEQVGLDISLDMGVGTVLGTTIGNEDMKKISARHKMAL